MTCKLTTSCKPCTTILAIYLVEFNECVAVVKNEYDQLWETTCLKLSSLCFTIHSVVLRVEYIQYTQSQPGELLFLPCRKSSLFSPTSVVNFILLISTKILLLCSCSCVRGVGCWRPPIARGNIFHVASGSNWDEHLHTTASHDTKPISYHRNQSTNIYRTLKLGFIRVGNGLHADNTSTWRCSVLFERKRSKRFFRC